MTLQRVEYGECPRFRQTPVEDFADEWETGVHTADVSDVIGNLCQDYLELNAADNKPRLIVSSSLPDRPDIGSVPGTAPVTPDCPDVVHLNNV